MVKGSGEVTEISNWIYLTADDEVKLFDELITSTQKWVKLVERLGEFRADEVNEAIYNASIDDVLIYASVDNAISEEYCKAYKNLPQQHTAKSRSIKAAISKIKAHEDAAYKLKLDLAKKYCDTHNIDFKKYLYEKELAENPEDDNRVSTETAFEIILNDME